MGALLIKSLHEWNLDEPRERLAIQPVGQVSHIRKLPPSLGP